VEYWAHELTNVVDDDDVADVAQKMSTGGFTKKHSDRGFSRDDLKSAA
jgi:hypothetical protein